MTRRLFSSVAGALAALALCALTSCSDQPVATDPGGIQAAKGGGGSGGPAVSRTDPDSAAQDTTLDVHVIGSGFDRGSRAEFALNGVVGPNIRTNSTRYVSSRELVANITIAADAVTDLYDVIVTTFAGKKGIGTEMFTVTLKVLDLGDLGGGSSFAWGISGVGHVVGESCVSVNPCNSHAFFWSLGGGMEQLPWPAGVTSARAEGVNNADQVVGHGNGYAEPLLWQRQGGVWTVQELPTEAGTGDAEGINNLGQVIGTQCCTNSREVVVWTVQGTAITRRRLPMPSTIGWGEAINDSGLAVGHSGNEAVLWIPDGAGGWTMMTLRPLPDATVTKAYAIGQIDATGRVRVSGVSWVANDYQAVRWTLERDGTGRWQVVSLEDLGAPGLGLGINTRGDVAGSNGNGWAMLWIMGAPPERLPSRAGMNWAEARAINESRWIAGRASSPKTGVERAVLWRHP